jgi:FkbM family methyltransferase
VLLRTTYRMLRHLLHRFGFDLNRFPLPGTLPSYLRRYNIETVLDVGANIGQYYDQLRRECRYRNRIISFEPLSREFASISARAARDENWTTINCALGREEGRASINVFEQSVFSSFLQQSEFGRGVHPSDVRREEVTVKCLDNLFPTLQMQGNNWMLKIDTQGFEKSVLEGAANCLPKFHVLQLELSLHGIYDGQPGCFEIIELLKQRDFVLSGLSRVLADEGNELLEIDGFFVRRNRAAAKQ